MIRKYKMMLYDNPYDLKKEELIEYLDIVINRQKYKLLREFRRDNGKKVHSKNNSEIGLDDGV